MLQKMVQFWGVNWATPHRFKNELELQQIASRAGISPKIELAWLNDEEGGFIMKTLDITVSQLTEVFSDIEVWFLIMDQLDDLVTKLSNLGIVHDLHSWNVMATYRKDLKPEDFSDQLELYKASNYKFYIIDFGKSYILPPREAYVKNMSKLNKLIDDSRAWSQLLAEL